MGVKSLPIVLTQQTASTQEVNDRCRNVFKYVILFLQICKILRMCFSTHVTLGTSNLMENHSRSKTSILDKHCDVINWRPLLEHGQTPKTSAWECKTREKKLYCNAAMRQHFPRIINIVFCSFVLLDNCLLIWLIDHSKIPLSRST